MGSLGTHGAPSPIRRAKTIFKKLSKNNILAFVGSKMVNKKVEIEGAGPPGEIRAEILRILPPEMSKTVGRIW